MATSFKNQRRIQLKNTVDGPLSQGATREGFSSEIRLQSCRISSDRWLPIADRLTLKLPSSLCAEHGIPAVLPEVNPGLASFSKLQMYVTPVACDRKMRDYPYWQFPFSTD